MKAKQLIDMLSKLDPESEVYLYNESHDVETYRGQISKTFRIQTGEDFEKDLDEYAKGLDASTTWFNENVYSFDPEIGKKIVLFGVDSTIFDDRDIIWWKFEPNND